MSAHRRWASEDPQFRAICTAPFGPSNFDRDPLATRQNLEFRIPPELEAYFDSVDKWMLEYLLANSERIFKKQLTASQVQDAYNTTLKRQGLPSTPSYKK